MKKFPFILLTLISISFMGISNSQAVEEIELTPEELRVIVSDGEYNNGDDIETIDALLTHYEEEEKLPLDERIKAIKSSIAKVHKEWQEAFEIHFTSPNDEQNNLNMENKRWILDKSIMFLQALEYQKNKHLPNEAIKYWALLEAAYDLFIQNANKGIIDKVNLNNLFNECTKAAKLPTLLYFHEAAIVYIKEKLNK